MTNILYRGKMNAVLQRELLRASVLVADRHFANLLAPASAERIAVYKRGQADDADLLCADATLENERLLRRDGERNACK